MQIFRVTVRGQFADLDGDQRARLVADAPAHDVVSHGRFSEEGTLSYEPSLHFFTFRVQLRTRGEEGEDEVVERAEAMAAAVLDRLGASHKGFRTQASDMATMWADRG